MGLQKYNDSRKLSKEVQSKIVHSLLKGTLQKVVAHELNVSTTAIKKIKRELPLLFWSKKS